MQVRESAIKGILRDKCVKAQNLIFDIKNFVSEAPENVSLNEEVNSVISNLSNLMQRFK